MNGLVISGMARFPELKEDKVERSLASGEYFNFPKRDILSTWKYKNYVHNEDLGMDYAKLINTSVKNVLKKANWQLNKSLATEYGIYLMTNEGSESAQIKYFQESSKETLEHVNPKSFTELYFNGVLNKLAEKYYFRGRSFSFWGREASVEVILDQAMLGIKEYRQKGCLIIVAEETSEAFGASVIFIEKDKMARARGVFPKYALEYDDKGKFLFKEFIKG